MDDRARDALRDHFDNTDLSKTIESAEWETEIESDPMIVTSVRLPKSLLDWVREQAAAEQIKPTALIRRWVEARRRASTDQQAGGGDEAVAQLAARVSRLEAVALSVVGVEQETDADSMTELLEALQASIDAAKVKCRPPSADQERRGA